MSAGVAVAAALGALIVVQIVHWIVLRIGRSSPVFTDLAHRAHRPLQAGLALIAIYYAVRDTNDPARWRHGLLHAIALCIVAAVAWLVGALLIVAEDWALARWRTDVADNRRARRLHTQVVMLRRVTLVVVAVIAFGVMLMTFPGARLFGTSVLASAGFAGIVAGFAAQSLLRNVIAGLQLAFSDAVRLGDVVVVEDEWGRIEEITLSYVVVHIWDDRRMILPTSYFTQAPFENWTRTDSSLLGSVELDVDWLMPVPDIREELRHVLERSDLWDGRVSVLQVTDATGAAGAAGTAIRLRALVSAADAPRLWDLRCEVREHLVAWVRDHHPGALLHTREEITNATPVFADPAAVAVAGRRRHEDQRVFGDSLDGRARGDQFVGPQGSEPDRKAGDGRLPDPLLGGPAPEPGRDGPPASS